MSLVKNAKQSYTVDFPPVYGKLNENKLLRAQQNQEGDTNIPFTVTVYFLAELTISHFIVFVLEDICFFLVAKKNGATHML